MVTSYDLQNWGVIIEVGGIIIAAVLVAAIVGIVMAIIGWCGRHVGNHWHCSRCNFDLHGLENPTNCPECGNLITRNSRCIGRFERRWTTLGVGVLLMLPGALFTVTDVVNRIRGVPWIQREPIWYLTRTMHPGDYLDPGPELKELRRRQIASELSNEQMKYLAREMIRLQELPEEQSRWHPMMGEIVEKARQLGNVSDEDWNRYLFDSSPAQLGVRAVTHTDDPLAVEFLKWFRLGDLRLPIVVEVESLQIDGKEITPLPPGINEMLRHGRTASMPFLVEEHLAPGTHNISVAVRIADHTTPRGAPPPTVSRTYTLTQSFVISSEAHTLIPRREKDLVEKYREALTPRQSVSTEPKPVAAVARYRGEKNAISFDFEMGMPRPVPGERVNLAYRIYVVANGKEIPAGKLCETTNYQGFSAGFGVAGIPDNATRVRLILRPDVDLALRTWRISDYLDAELDYDLPIVDQQ